MFDNDNSRKGLNLDTAADLKELESAISDPFIERVLAMARTYNAIFEESSPTDEEKQAIVEELDEEWGSIKGAPFRYTGMVMAVTSDTEGLKEVFLDGVDAISNGFTIVDEPVYVGGQHVRDISKVVHHFFAKVGDLYGEHEGPHEGTHRGCTGGIDSSHIEFDGASAERALAWLTASCPELIDEIDARMLNGEGGEDDALLKLRGLNFNEYANLDDLFTRNCINTYINAMIEIDTGVPYSAQIAGYLRKADEDESALYRITTNRSLVYIAAVILQPAFTIEDTDNKWDLAAHLAIIPENRSGELNRFVVPVDSLYSLKSIRAAYYEDQ